MDEISTIEYEKQYTENGYVKILVNEKFELEHRWIVSQIIGRELTKEEVVHHLDNNRQNNHPNNLMLFSCETEHQKFHYKIKRNGYTTNILNEIEHRWDKYNDKEEITIN